MNALLDIHFATPEKGLFAIEGKSGSGKSTLLNLLSLLEKPTKGKIVFLGRDLSSLSEKETLSFRNSVYGFVHQKFNLLEEEDVFYNIALPLLLRGEKKKEVQKRVDALLVKFSLTKMKNRKVNSLSGGEKQRVAILRSIVNDPKVVFADEPTGALDEKNSVLVMETLANIAKEKLVILVTHNQKLAERFANDVLVLSDGRIITKGDTKAKKIDEPFHFPSLRHHSSWRKPLFRSHLRKDKKKNALSFLSSSIAFIFLLSTLGFIFGSNDSLDKEKEKTLLLYQGGVAKKETYLLENSPLSLMKSSRPNKEELQALLGDDISVHNDYSYFFPRECAFSIAGNASHAYFEPIHDPTMQEFGRALLNEGSPFEEESLSFCFINDAFQEKFKANVGDEVHVPLEMDLPLEEGTASVSLSEHFVISGIIQEFGFLNLPRVYYSYCAYEERMKETYPRDSKRSLYEIVEEAEENEAISSFSYLLFAHDEESKNKLFSLVKESEGKEEGLSFSSYAFSIIESFSSLHHALGEVLVPFLVLGLLASSFNSGAIAFSSFLERKKEAAILTSLGAPFSSIVGLYAGESLFVAFLSIPFSMIVAFFLENPINVLLYRLSSIPSLIRIPFSSFLGFPLALPMISLFLAAFLALSGTIFPMLFFKRSTLLEELNDE